MNLVLTEEEEQFVDDNIHNKPIFAIARNLTEQRGLSQGDRIKRRELINYFKEKYNRNIFQEKFGGV